MYSSSDLKNLLISHLDSSLKSRVKVKMIKNDLFFNPLCQRVYLARKSFQTVDSNN